MGKELDWVYLSIFWLNWNVEIMILFIICSILLIYLLNYFFKYVEIDLIYISLFLLLIIIYILFRGCFLNLGMVNSNYFMVNIFYVLIKKIFLIFLIFYLILLQNYNILIKIPVLEYLILIFICVFALLIIIQSNHLFITFLFLELLNLSIYCLIGLNKESNMGIESSYKYFVQSSFATIIGFFGLSLIYISSGTLFINELGVLLHFNNVNILCILGIYFVITSVFFKLGIFPLHSWIADVYQGSLLISLVFIAILTKIGYIILFFNLFLEFNIIVQNYCILLSIISIMYGSIISLYQTSFKRLLAYGSMVHIGLIILSISIYTINSLNSGLFYIFTYLILMFFVFGFMFFLFEKNSNNIFYIDDISKLNIHLAEKKIFIIFFTFIILSLAGLPFFLGFIAKWYVFLSLLDYFSIVEVMFLLSISVLSSVYYIRILRFFYFSVKNKKIKRFNTFTFNNSIYNLIYVLFVFNMLAILFNNNIYLFLMQYIINVII